VKFLKLSPASSSPSFHQNNVCQHPSPYLTSSSLRYSIFLLFFFIFAPFFTFFPQDLSVSFLTQDLCHFPPHQAINERKQATDFLGIGLTRTSYKVGFGPTRTRLSSTPTPTTQPARTDEDRHRQRNWPTTLSVTSPSTTKIPTSKTLTSPMK
jgi:hypothetical protein